MQEIDNLLTALTQLYQKGFVSFHDLTEVKRQFQHLSLDRSEFRRRKIRLLFGLHFLQFFQFSRKAHQIYRYLEQREKLNQIFINQERQKSYEVEGHPLDPQQIEAVVACEDAELFLAPAGSGKTASLLAKVDYLINRLQIPADQILLITFTNKVVAELKDRVANHKVEIRTFHSLGNKLLQNHQAHTKKRKIITEQETTRFFQQTIKKLRSDNSEYARRYNDYLLFYQSVPLDLQSLKNEQERIDFNRTFLRQTLQAVSLSKQKYDTKNPTLQQEYVKSKEEQIIANWLFVNRIKYTYERQYDHTHVRYLPDFTILQFSEPIYYEHFALDRHGKSWYEGYLEQIAWKRDLHRRHHTTLIETYSYEWQDGTLLANLEKRLKKAGLKIDRRREEEISKLLAADLKYRADAEALESLFISVLQLQKSERLSLTELKKRIQRIENQFTRLRSLKFFDLYSPLYQAYEQHLKLQNLYDFADMLGEATDTVQSLPKSSLHYQYILVDEAQDLSQSKYALLKAILGKCHRVKLFAVGDDWQSIYRFAGSNLKVLDDFEAIFQRQTYRGLIELTYRFGEPTAKISNQFIQKNPHQSKKQVTPHQAKQTLIQIQLNTQKYDQDTPRDYAAVNQKIQELYQEYGAKITQKRIQIISRYNRDIYRIVNQKTNEYQNAKLHKTSDGKVELSWRIPDTDLKLTIPFCSMHKAKGITRDIVFVINMNAGILGMPSTRSDDPVIATMLAEIDPYPFAEERRLFYVAITRATTRTILIAEANQISQFIYEISPNLKDTGVKICPRCKTGIMIERTRKRDNKTFYSCSNFVNGCKYSE